MFRESTAYRPRMGWDRGALVEVTPPAEEPITVNEAKEYCRLELSDSTENNLISQTIEDVRNFVEETVDRQLITATYDYTLDGFPQKRGSDGFYSIYLPRPPLQSVTSITYTDIDGNPQTITASDYIVDSASEPGRIAPAPNFYWPSSREQANSVTIRYVAGYGAAAAVPGRAKDLLRQLVDHRYNFRGAALTWRSYPIPLATESLLWSLSWGDVI